MNRLSHLGNALKQIERLCQLYNCLFKGMLFMPLQLILIDNFVQNPSRQLVIHPKLATACDYFLLLASDLSYIPVAPFLLLHLWWFSTLFLSQIPSYVRYMKQPISAFRQSKESLFPLQKLTLKFLFSISFLGHRNYSKCI